MEDSKEQLAEILVSGQEKELKDAIAKGTAGENIVLLSDLQRRGRFVKRVGSEWETFTWDGKAMVSFGALQTETVQDGASVKIKVYIPFVRHY